MNLEDYRTLFVGGSLVLILVATTPALSLVIPVPSGTERFSELWLLGPNHMAEGYPFNVHVNETYRFFVGVGNHMGGAAYYMVYVKLRNQSQSPPDIVNSKPSPLSPLYGFQVFLADGDSWESNVTFTVLDAFSRDDTTRVTRISFNDMIFSVNSVSKWNEEYGGFYYQLFFELWLYNTMSQSFQYHQRFVGIWLNMTGS